MSRRSLIGRDRCALFDRFWYAPFDRVRCALPAGGRFGIRDTLVVTDIPEFGWFTGSVVPYLSVVAFDIPDSDLTLASFPHIYKSGDGRKNNPEFSASHSYISMIT